MSQRLREQLEYIAGLCNNGESHVAGDAVERLLGYPIDHQGDRIVDEDGGEVKGETHDQD
jgi:hypothetical protein